MAYGNVEGLRRECEGVDLRRIATGGTLEAILRDELELASIKAEDTCHRRPDAFDHHEDDTITIDGTGLPTLRLSPHGYVPLLDVLAITIGGDAQVLTDFDWYEDGLIEYQRGAIDSATASTVYSFTPGTQNIELTIDWGYASTETAVIAAVYLFAKAKLMQRIAAGLDPTELAVPPGAIRYQLGEFSVQFDADGQYGPQIKAAKREARELLGRYMLPVMSGPRGRRAYRGSATGDAALAHYREDA